MRKATWFVACVAALAVALPLLVHADPVQGRPRIIRGPSSSTDNAIIRYNGTSGQSAQGSLVTIGDTGNISVPALATVDGVDISVALAGGVAVPNTRAVNATSPLGGGGALSGDLTLTCTTCIAGALGSSDNRALRSDGTGGVSAQGSSVIIDDSGNIGVGGLTPTHSVSIPAAGSFALYNAAGADRVVLSTSGNIFNFKTEPNGGTNRTLVVGSGSATGITFGSSGVLTYTPGIGATVSTGAHEFTNGGVSFSATSGAQYHARFTTSVNQASGSATFDQIYLNPTFTACGSGGCTFLRGVDNATERFRVNSAGTPTFAAGTAPPASGSAVACVKVSSTANLGFCVGDGAPTFSAAKGTFYSNTTATTTTTRLYVNTDGGTTWTNLTTGS